MQRSRLAAITITIVLVVAASIGIVTTQRPTPAGAFGSVSSSILGQTPAHEKITRTLACAANDPVTDCFGPRSIDILAGTNGTWGAVGEPDDPLDGNPNPAARHCDNIDYGLGSGRTEADATSAFTDCLVWFQSYLDFSVASAAKLLRADGTIDPAQIVITNSLGSVWNACAFPDPQKGSTSNDSAKCNVLNGLGRALHDYEDVWSHSNWGDTADPTRAIDATNPNGLANTAQPAFMTYPGPRAGTIPTGLLSGCDDSVPLINDCTGTDSSGAKYVRVGHSSVNKDNGTVDPNNCAATNPTTTRGRVVVDGVSNFQRAVTGACGAARRAWSDLRAALIARYGSTAAATMIRAIIDDHPLTRCTIGGTAVQASSNPVGDVASARTVTIQLTNATGRSLSCASANLDAGEWASYPPDVIAAGATGRWRTQSDGIATGTAGNATLSLGDGSASVVVRWNNPYWLTNSSSCDAPAGTTCTITGGKGDDATLSVTLTGP